MTERQPNPAQHIAIHQIDSNIAVTAGAGSGKTTVLVGRYLTLLESGRRVSELVAITFTRKAAAEMSARLREDLEKRLSLTTHPAHHRLLTAALQEMNAARISTIHSLCGDIVRANAAQCSIDPSFTVLDEVQGKLMFNAARDRVLRQLGSAPSASPDAQAAVRVIHDYGLKTVKDALKVDLVAGVAESAPETVEDILAEWMSAWRTAIGRTVAGLLVMPEAQDLLTIAAPAEDAMGESALIVKSGLQKLSQDDAALWSNALTQITKVKLNAGSQKNWAGYPLSKDDAKALIKVVRSAVSDDIIDTIGLAPDDDLHREAADYLMGWRVIAGRTWAEYQAAKRRQNALDFNDLERLAGQVLTDEAVAARYRAQFAHVMVDEFQDTSAAQWEIIRRIAPPDQPGRLFIVGDPKQSIYGFRGSDHTVFTSATRIIRTSGGLQTPPVQTAVSLSTSYRTHKPLLDAMNTLFAGVMTVPDDANAAGYVRFEALDAGRLDVRGDTPFLRAQLFSTDQPVIPGVEKWNSDPARLQEAADLATQIVTLHREAGVRYGDIAILCRTSTKFNIYEDALRVQGIPYITNAGRGYFNRQEVADLVTLLKALYNEGDHLALAAALHSPLFGLSDAALYALRGVPNPSLWEAVTVDAPPADFPDDERDALNFARRILLTLKPRARRARIADILREAVDATGYLAFLESQSHGTQSRANVQKLIEQAEKTGVVTLSQFLTYIEQVKTAEARESDAALDAENAVQLMTIHASKGLEFSVVFLPGANDHKNPEKDPLLLHPTLGLACKMPTREIKAADPFPYLHAKAINEGREEAESLRLFYVAATRAKDRLIVSGYYKPNADGENTAGGRMGHLLAHQATLIGAHGDDIAYTDISARVLARNARADTVSRTLPTVNAAVFPATPPLFEPIKTRLADRAKHVTTTDLSHLSQSRHAPTAPERDKARNRFRRGVLGGSDSAIRFLTGGSLTSRAPSRVVGEVVHEAIRFGYDAEPDDALRRLLKSLVWGQALAPDLHADAVARALNLIQRYRRSELYADIKASPAVYREIPFVYHLNGSIIHGQIDLLFKSPDGAWTLVDYKTDYIHKLGWGYDEDDLRAHSQRHLIQLAVYASAVRARLESREGFNLQVKLHYIAADATLALTHAELDAALVDGLSTLVRQALGAESEDV